METAHKNMSKKVQTILLALIITTTGFAFFSLARAQSNLTCTQLKKLCLEINIGRTKEEMIRKCNFANQQGYGCVPMRTWNMDGGICTKMENCVVDPGRCGDVFENNGLCCDVGYRPDLTAEPRANYVGYVCVTDKSFNDDSTGYCRLPHACSTSPQCSDGIDNDNDGKTDFPDDPGCFNKNDNDEINKGCCNGETPFVDGGGNTFCLAPDPNNSNQGLFWPPVLPSQCPREGLPSQCGNQEPPPPPWLPSRTRRAGTPPSTPRYNVTEPPPVFRHNRTPTPNPTIWDRLLSRRSNTPTTLIGQPSKL